MPVLEEDDYKLYATPAGSVVFGNTVDVCEERLERMFPLDKEMRHLSDDLSHVFRGVGVSFERRQVRRLIVLEDVGYTGDIGDERLDEILDELHGGVLIVGESLSDVRNSRPHCEGYRAAMLSRRFDTDMLGRWIDNHDPAEKVVRLTYHEKYVGKSAAAAKAAVSRDAVFKYELRMLMSGLADSLPYRLAAHRWTTWSTAKTCDIIDEIDTLLGHHEVVYGRYYYRRIGSYQTFIQRVQATERATLKKFRSFEGFTSWLKAELRSKAARLIRLKKWEETTPFHGRQTDPFHRAQQAERYLEERRKKQDAELKAKEKEEGCDRWSWIEREKEKKEKAAPRIARAAAKAEKEKEARKKARRGRKARAKTKAQAARAKEHDRATTGPVATACGKSAAADVHSTGNAA